MVTLQLSCKTTSDIPPLRRQGGGADLKRERISQLPMFDQVPYWVSDTKQIRRPVSGVADCSDALKHGCFDSVDIACG